MNGIQDDERGALAIEIAQQALLGHRVEKLLDRLTDPVAHRLERNTEAIVLEVTLPHDALHAGTQPLGVKDEIDQLPYLLARIAAAPLRGGEIVDHQRGHLFRVDIEQLEQDLTLVLEVAVQASDRDAGLGGDHGRGGVVEAIALEALRGGREYGFAGPATAGLLRDARPAPGNPF